MAVPLWWATCQRHGKTEMDIYTLTQQPHTHALLLQKQCDNTQRDVEDCSLTMLVLAKVGTLNVYQYASG